MSLAASVGNQQKWDRWEPERLLLSRVSDELPEGPVVASALQDSLPVSVEQGCGHHVAQRLVIPPVVVEVHESPDGLIQI